MNKARVLVVDDHPLVRLGLVDFINRKDDLIVCGQAQDSATTQTAVLQQKPDLVLLDLRLNSEDGLELIKALLAQFPDLRILVLSASDENIYAERAIRAGARGFVMKAEAAGEVLCAIRTVLGGEIYVSRRVAVRLFQKSLEARPQTHDAGIESLTDRELQVFRLLGAGLSTRKIAGDLKLSFKTIETYRENIKHKLHLANAAELVRRAEEWVQTSSDV